MKDMHAGVAWSGQRHRPGGRPGRHLAASLVGLTVLISGCAGSGGAASPGALHQTATRPGPEPSATPSAVPSAKEPSHQAPGLPAPDAAIPKDPSRLADSLTGTAAQLRRAIDDWVRDGGPTKADPPEPVVLLALHEQRIYRYLARNPQVASRTYDRLPKDLAGRARDNVTAVRNLLSLARPVSGPVKFRVRPPEPANVLLDDFRRAERRFGVEWEVLAAVMFVETKFGRVRSPSYTGAQGPMQFMPGTWAAYGMGGDVHDTKDALLAAANYLHASGAPRDYRRALYAYNHSKAYVDAVLLHARQMKRDIRNYYGYYNWQVFVITTRGERRLTGP
ncbi:lytic murein transglycosylase [Planotetraspora sp. A-T 1434]|uniref:lytic transglycosylase domain-containing protein n=1 Tax=Planotetraspora sp. A-T 1434 TaxID=2979219 RepID=UPI0021BE5BB9|nr:lytic murein transglycosylase [Planotetraspora sp. A-T 1434]MCT9932017.1 lytic murein transglycosylase [Planotetraspora sp. A-T 1434]